MQETWVWFLGWDDPLEKRKDYPLQYSGLENSMDCIVHGVTKGRTQLSNFHFHNKGKKTEALRPFKLYSCSNNNLVNCSLHCCCSVAQSYSTLCDPMDSSTPGFPVLLVSQFAQTYSHWVNMPSNHLILCHPFLLLPSIFPALRYFPMHQLFASAGLDRVLKLQLQHQSFHWIFRVDFL